MTLYVPEIGDNLLLTRDWQFILHPERRNTSIANGLGLSEFSNYDTFRKRIHGWYNLESVPNIPEFDWRRNGDYVYRKDWENSRNEWVNEVSKILVSDLHIIFPTGTILKVDRVYIRKGAKDFSSITFHAKNLEIVNGEFTISNKKKPKSFRFWAKLSDCNTINFELIEETK